MIFYILSFSLGFVIGAFIILLIAFRKMVGTMNIDLSDEETDRYSLELSEPFSVLNKSRFIIFKVKVKRYFS